MELAQAPADLAQLQAEVGRLAAELQEATQEKVQAAQYGLAVLEENGELKQRCGELEGQLDRLSSELTQMKEALAECHSSHKRAAVAGENREESLVREAAAKEAQLAACLEEQQGELRQLRCQLSNAGAESERLSATLQDLRQECQALDAEKAQLREELKQHKSRELRQLQDCAELEEENISLQKQVSMLKGNQFEALKHELRRREEEALLAGAQLEELGRLRELAERQLEEALETLVVEREQQRELRRELVVCTGGRPGSLGSLQAGLEELSQDEELDSGFANGSASVGDFGERASTPRARPAPGLVADLFSELSLAEVHKLRQQLLQGDRERASLAADVQEARRQLDSAREALAEQQQRNGLLLEQLQARPASPEPQPRQDLEGQLRAARKLAGELQARLAQAQEELLGLTEDLATLYHQVCAWRGLTPQRVVLDYYRDGGGTRRPPGKPEPGAGPCGDQSSPGEPLNVSSLAAVLREQLGHLQGALVLWRQQPPRQGPPAAELERDKEALAEEVLKLRSLLSTKREQIATLRTVLKANKQTAEAALSKLKGQYEGEKALVSDTMLKLRRELKALKEDATTFSSLRAMFASRCDQYVSQLDEMQRQLAVAEDEKKTLSSLLRMAIQQKLALTQRLESLASPARGTRPRPRSTRSTADPALTGGPPEELSAQDPAPQLSPVEGPRQRTAEGHRGAPERGKMDQEARQDGAEVLGTQGGSLPGKETGPPRAAGKAPGAKARPEPPATARNSSPSAGAVQDAGVPGRAGKGQLVLGKGLPPGGAMPPGCRGAEPGRVRGPRGDPSCPHCPPPASSLSRPSPAPTST
ncbi:leucyl-tRNA synthetase [Platysternon megacephalum]|uniref:Leucyl-tRNA synthetase n=1 Tax=Platysternon megacephalum TaxID=55544 RepID=A0A4D9DIL6_9SAUR|nr:leucyl-tRNA synthetase [Platysternon megacephalum]